MLLAADIGNTNIAFGKFKNRRMVRRWQIATKKLSKNTRIDLRGIEAVIISSVAPKALSILKRLLKKHFKGELLILGENIECPIVNLYGRPEQVGQDRLVNGLAAYIKCKSPVVVIDFGTAVTFDVVSAKGEYLGGIIAPGIRASLSALSQRAALLPYVELKKPRGLIGKSTIESMLSGAVYGYAAMCDGIIKNLEAKFGRNLKVIATGGDAGIIKPYTKSIRRIYNSLTLEGLNLIYLKKK